jgi:hypothetical protein
MVDDCPDVATHTQDGATVVISHRVRTDARTITRNGSRRSFPRANPIQVTWEYRLYGRSPAPRESIRISFASTRAITCLHG